MRYISLFLLVLFLGFGVFVSSHVQAQILPASNAEQGAVTAPEFTPDVLGRRNPQGTVLGYIGAMAQEDYEKAAQYFDLSGIKKSKRAERGEEIAKQFQMLLDQSGNIQPGALLSDQYEGQSNDNLDLNLDKVGSFKWNDQSIPVYVEKTQGEDGAPIWLISSQTIEKLPDNIEETASITVNQILPKTLVEHKWGGVPAGHWLAMLLLIGASYLFAWAITSAFANFIRLCWRKAHIEHPLGLVQAFAIPIRLYMAVWILVLSAQKLGISIIVRQYFSEATIIVAWIAILILLWRLIDVFSAFGERRMVRRNNLGGLSAVLFFRRSIKFILIAVGIITILDTMGWNVTTGLAALGIGGIALALGAQKTVENLVGSLTVIFDQPVRVGDFCKVGETLGTVEQIGMRSTRIRTLDRTLVTIPNGEFSAQKIENYAHRDRFWFHPTLGLRYETSPDQMRYILVELRSILYAHPRVDPDPARVRFLGFGADALNVEIFAYIHASDYNEYLEIQEDLNLRIADVIDASGTGFAFPSQTLYMARDTGLSEEKTKAAEAKVKEWNEKEELQLPNFDFERIKELRSTIEYPPEGSSARPKKQEDK